jgi:hypothetical protein
MIVPSMLTWLYPAIFAAISAERRLGARPASTVMPSCR